MPNRFLPLLTRKKRPSPKVPVKPSRYVNLKGSSNIALNAFFAIAFLASGNGIVKDVTTAEGEFMRRFFDMKLERSRTAIFALT